MARLLRERTTLRVVTDQRSRPTSAEWLAQATLELALGNQRGTFHVTDGGECSRYELSLYIARLLASRCAIEPCPSTEFPSPARRPEYSVLDISKAERTLGPFPSFEENVKLVLTGEGPARGSP
jgi:dTDP-4-dehydrorhamnose reductase